MTAVFGVFGAIPAAIGANADRRLGFSGSRQWRAFIITFLVDLTVLFGVSIYLLIAIRASVESSDRADRIRTAGVGACVEYPIASYIDLSAPAFADAQTVNCSQPHVFEILSLGSEQTALAACDGKYRMTTADRYVNILDTDTVRVTDDLWICEGSNTFTGLGKRVAGSFIDGTAAPANQ